MRIVSLDVRKIVWTVNPKNLFSESQKKKGERKKKWKGMESLKVIREERFIRKENVGNAEQRDISVQNVIRYLC